MKSVLTVWFFLFPVHHAPPPPPLVPVIRTVSTTTTSTTTTTTTASPTPAMTPPPTLSPPQTAAPVTVPGPISWQVAWIVRCPPSPGTWYTYTGSEAQAEEIYNQQVALIGQESSPGCYYGSVSNPEQVGEQGQLAP